MGSRVPLTLMLANRVAEMENIIGGRRHTRSRPMNVFQYLVRHFSRYRLALLQKLNYNYRGDRKKRDTIPG